MYTLQLVLAGLVAVVHAQFGAYPNPNGGGIKLIGSSFGLLGQNATFDYIVSRACLQSSHGQAPLMRF